MPWPTALAVLVPVALAVDGQSFKASDEEADRSLTALKVSPVVNVGLNAPKLS